jgi:hypothetical protein
MDDSESSGEVVGRAGDEPAAGDTAAALDDADGARVESDDAAEGSQRANEASVDEIDPTVALSKKPTTDPIDSDELLPRCAAPVSAEFGYPTFGSEAVRLHWKPETGECKFTSGDGTPSGWSGILTLRHHGEDTFLSGIGRWRYFAPKGLDLDDLPAGRTLTFYPYLDEWQFVADVRYDGETVTIERFEYIEGQPPDDYGVPDRTANDPGAAEPNLVDCSSLNGEASK